MSRGKLDQSLEIGGDDFVSGATERASQHRRKATDDTTVTSIRLDREVHRRMKMAAVAADKSLSEVVSEAFALWEQQQASASDSDGPSALDDDEDGL